MHQILFYIGDFPIRSYGAVLSLSIFLATGVGYFMAKVDGRGYEKFIVDTGLIGGFFGLLGARLWDVFFFDWNYYQNHLDEILNGGNSCIKFCFTSAISRFVRMARC